MVRVIQALPWGITGGFFREPASQGVIASLRYLGPEAWAKFTAPTICIWDIRLR